MTRRLFALSAIALAAPAAHAQFITPAAYGWDRGDADSTYFEWDAFASTTGGNAPDVGQFPASLPAGWAAPDVFDESGLSVISGSGNIYSPSAPLLIVATAPDYALGAGRRTTVLVQVRTLGTEFDPATITFDGLAPAETTELARVELGGFGGFQVDTLFRFELDASAADHVFTLDALGPHMSFDRLAIDTFAHPACIADFNGDGALSVADFTAFRAAYLAGDMAADLSGNGALDVADFTAFRNAYLAGCA